MITFFQSIDNVIRYGKSPKVDRAVAHHSAAPVSQADGSSSESKSVSEPKFKPAAKFRSQTAMSMATVDEFLKQKGELDQQRFEAQQERFAREEKRAECMSKIEVARAVLSAPATEVHPDVKAAANRFLCRFFDT